MTCKSKVQKINNTLTGNKQKLSLKPHRILPASVMKRKQSQSFVLRMPSKMGCLKIAKVGLWQKNKKFKAHTKEALCKKWLCYRGTPECSIPKSLYTQKMYFTYCHFNQVFHLHCAEFDKRGCFSIRQLGGVWGCIPVLSSILGLKPYLCDFCNITFSLKVRWGDVYFLD